MASQPKSSSASRYLFLFLIGLVVGAVATVMVMRALEARRDFFPDATMHVMGKHNTMLGDTVRQNRCAATDLIPHVRALRSSANDLELAFPDLATDERFQNHASKFRGTLDAAIANPPTDCAAGQQLTDQIKDSCKSCHQDFRG